MKTLHNIQIIHLIGASAFLAAALAVNITCSAQDSDRDGIPDQVEQQILNTYRPWLYYDAGEDVWPCSAIWFVTNSSLIHVPDGDIDEAIIKSNPHIILEHGASWPGSPPPGESPQKLNLDDDYRTGEHPDDPSQSQNVPIYGHVAPLPTDWKYKGFDGNFPGCGVLVQYWILFPYNNAHKWDGLEGFGCEDIGDHEGDWVWMDLILDADGVPQYAVYHHHGDKALGGPTVVSWDQVEKRDGAPVAYLEMGVHELWPCSGAGGCPGGPAGITSPIHPHFGNGVQYQPNIVLNLGEAGKPAQQASPEAQLDVELALQFNGEWGDFTGCGGGIEDITNPGGPLNQSNPETPERQSFPIPTGYPGLVMNYPSSVVQGTDPGLCSAIVNFDVTAANNCKGFPVICVPPAGSSFIKGVTAVNCTASDAFGYTTNCSFNVTIEDREPPQIAGLSVTPAILWPNNHKMIDVQVSYEISDNCALRPTFIRIFCNESVDATGDGHSSPDWQIVDSHHVRLRAERAGSGNGRVYTIAVTATDDSGNSSSKTVSVQVPKSQK